MKKKRDKHEIRDMVETELLELSKVMVVTESMRKFDELKYPRPRRYRASDIKKIRGQLEVSQAVLAYILNVRKTTLQKWELGINTPNGSSARLLQLMEQKGKEVLQGV
ncbi:MAG: transcriptional regulator [Candidatus Omnitrophica bacterium]|nr:transcriptional regulator [Candidatus Omnitrophota bacterium]